MKKNLALILALVMLMGTIFPVLPVAAADETPSATVAYEPKVSYANVVYSGKMEMMFAVPVPTAPLGEGEEVKLLVWGDKNESEAYSVKDQLVTKLTAEETTILGTGAAAAEYLVFKYDGLGAADMTQIVAVRPIVYRSWQEEVTTIIPAVKDETTGEVTTPESSKTEIVTKEEAVTYGDIVEYSVVEYAATAKGEFEGIDKVSDESLAAIDALLAFGGLVQKFSANADSYDYFANDTLAKIWYTPVINGVAGERVFGGFYKVGADYATLSAPYMEGYKFNSYTDANGKVLKDVNGIGDDGVQVAAPLEGGDLEIFANYGALVMMESNPNGIANGHIDNKSGKTNLYDTGLGLGAQTGEGPEALHVDVWYWGLDVMDDPYSDDPEEKVYRIANNTSYNLVIGDSTANWKVSLNPKLIPGFNDTIAPVITYEVTLGLGDNGSMPPSGRLSLRTSSSAITDLGKFSGDGTFNMYYTDPITGEEERIATTAKVAKEGYTTFYFIVDYAAEIIYLYTSENGGDLVYHAQNCSPRLVGAHKTAESWLDWAMTTDRIEYWGDKFGSVAMSETDLAGMADLDGDGVGETPYFTKEGDVTAYNRAAIQWFYEKNHSFYMKSIRTYVGSPLESFPDHEHTYADGKCACGAKDPNYVPPEPEEEPFDPAVAQALYRQYRALLIKDWDSYVGYAGNPVETIYNIDANAANVPSKNSQLMINNFTDDFLAEYYKGEGYDGKTLTLGGLGMNAASVDQDEPLQYAGIDVIDDPYYTGEGANKVYSFNGGVVKQDTSLGAYIWHGKLTRNAAEAYVGSLSVKDKASFAETPVITYDMTVGGNGYDRMLETDTIRFRGASNTYVHLFKIAADGSILVCKPNADYNDAVFEDTGVDVKKNGWTRIVAEVDCANKVFKLYAADEGAELVCVATVSDNLWITKSGISHNGATALTTYKDAADWKDLAEVIDRTEIMAAAGDANTLTEEELLSVLKD